MAYQDSDALRYYQFEIFDSQLVRQGVFTRRGGVSPSPWNSLNVGGLNGDERANVLENRRRMFAAFGRPVESLFDVWQVHSADTVIANHPRPLDAPHQQADIIITDRPEVTLFMRFGDCVPILLHDPVRGVIALAHAGWQGTVRKVPAEAVRQMQQVYHSNPADIIAGIGPSVGPHHYQVGQDVVTEVQQSFGADSAGLLLGENGSVHFDLWQANKLLLEQAGVRHIQVAGVCTVCNLEDWFSHRGDKGKTGRFGALFALENHRRE